MDRFFNKYRLPAPGIIHVVQGALTVSLIAFLYPILQIHKEVYTEAVFRNDVLFIHFPLLYISVIVLFFISIVFKLSWERTEIHPAIVLLIRVLSLCLAWNYLFYDYNFYFDQWHFFDRLLIFGLAISALKYPLHIIPLLMQLNLMEHQFNFPFGGSSFLDKTLPYNLLMVSASYCLTLFLLRGITLKTRFKTAWDTEKIIIYLLLITLAAPYYHSGLEKLLISPNGYEWFIENDLSNNIKAMHNRGWLYVFPWLHHKIISLFNMLQIPGQFIILVGELAFLLILFSRRFSFWLIILMIMLHLGVFVMNGAFFWIWIIANLGLLYMFKKRQFQLSLQTGIIGMVCIHFSTNIIDVTSLGWYDAPLDNRFELFADGEKISEASMAPYTMHFQLGNIMPLLDRKAVNAGFLIFDYEQYSTIRNLQFHELSDFIETAGDNRYNPEIEKNMRRFLSAYLANDRKNPVRWLQPPAYWNVHVFSGYSVVNGLDVNIIQLFNQFDWNGELQSKSFNRQEIIRVSK